jgi:hypothetical protein
MEAQNAFRFEYRQAINWPKEYKEQNGKWPTWEEIANQFPVIGAYIRSLVAGDVAA